MIKGAIFDVDGTLLDSMSIWEDCSERFLRSLHIVPEENLNESMWEMNVPEAVAYIRKKYVPWMTDKEIADGMIGQVADFYRDQVQLKKGVLSLLQRLKKENIPMVIATASDRSYLQAAFDRLGINEYFLEMVSSAETGVGKTKPDIYLKCAEILGTKPGETWVFEDVEHAVRTAKNAGFRVAGVYDYYSREQMESISAMSDIYLQDMTDIDGFMKFAVD